MLRLGRAPEALRWSLWPLRPRLRMDAAADAAAPPGEGEAGAPDGGQQEKDAGAGAAAKAPTSASAALNDLDDSLPPSLRTAKLIAKKLGTNKAARSACMALAGGERLTKMQKKALFKMGIREAVPPQAMVAMVKQADGLGVTPMDLGAEPPPARPLSLQLWPWTSDSGRGAPL